MEKNMKKRIIIILAISILLVVAIMGIKKVVTVYKMNKYINLTDFDYQSHIDKKGHITKEDAIKIVAIKDKSYIKNYGGVSDVIIKLKEDPKFGKYWSVKVLYKIHSPSSDCYSIYEINYFTGKLLVKKEDGDMATPSNLNPLHINLTK